MTSEIKFLLDAAQSAAILAWARRNLSPDPHAAPGLEGYQVTSLYFDTPERDVLHRRGSYARSKYRIRRYQASDLVFLERKMKNGVLVGKTRSLVPQSELPRLEAVQPDMGWDGYWFHRRLQARRLQPFFQIVYQRSAFVGVAAAGAIRLTLDHDLRAVPAQHLRFRDRGPGIELLPGRRILELKFQREMPALFRQLLAGHALTPQSVSKYRLACHA